MLWLAGTTACLAVLSMPSVLDNLQRRGNCRHHFSSFPVNQSKNCPGETPTNSVLGTFLYSDYQTSIPKRAQGGGGGALHKPGPVPVTILVCRQLHTLSRRSVAVIDTIATTFTSPLLSLINVEVAKRLFSGTIATIFS